MTEIKKGGEVWAFLVLPSGKSKRHRRAENQREGDKSGLYFEVKATTNQKHIGGDLRKSGHLFSIICCLSFSSRSAQRGYWTAEDIKADMAVKTTLCWASHNSLLLFQTLFWFDRQAGVFFLIYTSHTPTSNDSSEVPASKLQADTDLKTCAQNDPEFLADPDTNGRQREAK